MCWLQNMKQSTATGGRMIRDGVAEKVGKGARRTSYTCSLTSRVLQRRTAFLGNKGNFPATVRIVPSRYHPYS